MKKRIFLVVVLVVLTSVSLLFAAGSKEAASAKKETITLTFSTSVYVEEPHRVAIDKLLDAYEASHPNVKIQIFGAGWADYWNNLTTEVLAGNEADIIQVYPENIASYNSLRSDGVCTDLTSLMKRDGITTDMLSGQEYCEFDGENLALSNYAWGTTGLFYNKSMLADAGIDPASIKTQEDFLDVSRKFVKQGKYAMGIVVGTHSFVVGEWARLLGRVVSNGLYFKDGEKGPFTADRVNINDPSNVWAAKWWQDYLLKEKAGKPGPDKKDSRELFWNGNVPFNMDGPWFIGMTRERDAAFMDNMGLIPQFDVVYKGKTYKPNPTNYPIVSMLSKNCKHPEEAWDFMKWMTSDEAQKIIAQCGMIPSSKSYSSSEEYKNAYPLAQLFPLFAKENYTTLISDPSIPQHGEIQQVMIDATQAMFSSRGADVQTTMNDAQKKIEAIMKK